MTVARPRIGTGAWMFVVGGLLMLLGGFATVGGDPGFGGPCIGLASALISVAFITRLFGMIERRLIDVERALKGPEAPQPEPEVGF